MKAKFQIQLGTLKRIVNNMNKFVDKEEEAKHFALTLFAIGRTDKTAFITATNGRVLVETHFLLDDDYNEHEPNYLLLVHPESLLEELNRSSKKRNELVTVKIDGHVWIDDVSIVQALPGNRNQDYPDLDKLNKGFDKTFEKHLACKFGMFGTGKYGVGLKNGIDDILQQARDLIKEGINELDGFNSIRSFKSNAVVSFNYESLYTCNSEIYARELNIELISKRGIDSERFHSYYIGDIERNESKNYEEFYGLPNNAYSYLYLSNIAELLSKSSIQGRVSDEALLQLVGEEDKVTYKVTIMPIIL